MESHLENESTLPSSWSQEKMMQGLFKKKKKMEDEDYNQFEEYLKLEKIWIFLSI